MPSSTGCEPTARSCWQPKQSLFPSESATETRLAEFPYLYWHFVDYGSL
jgi:hypothetical protein